MPAIGIILEDGLVSGVVTDGEDFAGCEVIVLTSDRSGGLEPEKQIRATSDYEGIIARYVTEARSKTQVFALGTACELAAERFTALSQMRELAPQELLAEIERGMRELAEAVHMAVSATRPGSPQSRK